MTDLMKKIIELAIIIGFDNDNYNEDKNYSYLNIDNFFYYNNNEYVLHLYVNSIKIVKNEKYIRTENGWNVLKEDYVIEYLNKEFIDIIRKHKINKLL